MLPVIDNRVVYDIKLPESKRSLKIKSYKSAQEKVLLQAILDRKDRKGWFVNILEILKNNKVEGEVEFNNTISTIDFLYLCVKLRSVSKGEIFNYSFKCDGTIMNEGKVEECEHIFKESDNLDSLLIVKNSDVTKVICEVNEKLSLELRTPTIAYYEYLAGLKEEIENDIETMDDEAFVQKKNLELFMNQLCFSVSKVIIKEDGKPRIYTDFTPEELKENILLNLSYTELNKIFEEKKKLIKLVLRIRKVCPKCKSVFEREESNFFEYVA
jgi:hypothetical protein